MNRDEYNQKRAAALLERKIDPKKFENAPLRIPLPCIYRSENPIEWSGCGCSVFDCAIHERCVPWRKKNLVDGISVCDECNERVAVVPPPPEAVHPDPFYALKNPLPHGCPTDAAIQTAMRSNSEIRTAMPPEMTGRGVVFAAGGWRFMCGVFVSVRMLRWLGCDYPVEVWYNGDLDGEYHPEFEWIMRDLGVTFRDAAVELRRLGITRRSSLGGWPLKPLAYLLSSFAEVLGLDSDCYPVLDPRPLFDHPKYKLKGAVLWPDLGRNKFGAPLDPGQWARFGLEDRQTPGIESGQVLIDKRRHWHSLAITTWLNDHHDFCYRPQGPAGLHGDKDTFAIGFHAVDEWGGNKTGAPYAMAPPTRWVHVAFMQHGLNGETMFVHRCRDKPRIEVFEYGTSQKDSKMIRCDHVGKKQPAIAHEWKVFDLVEEYRRAVKGKQEIDDHVRKQNEFIASIPPAPHREGHGIVTMTSPSYWPGTYVLLKMLRHINCQMPVQVWLRPCEGVPDWLLTWPGVTVRTFKEDRFETFHRIEAIIRSEWKEVVFIDSDAYPLIDPVTCLLDLRENGFITWQDHPDGDEFFPELYGLPPEAKQQTFALQNAVMVLDVQKSWRPLQLANYFCHDQDFYFPGQLMDQAQFRAAWALLSEPPMRYGDGRVLWDDANSVYHIHLWRDAKTPFVIHRGSCKFGLPDVFLRPPIRDHKIPLDDVMWNYFNEYLQITNKSISFP